MLSVLMNGFKVILHNLVDTAYKARNRFRRRFILHVEQDASTVQSDSQRSFYVEAINAILSDDVDLRKFRRIYDYREILEHVDLKLGKNYADKILRSGFDIKELIPHLQGNDTFGDPRRYYFPNLGLFSPTTLRYVSVALELRQIFGDYVPNVVEIGGGYGGQVSILRKMNFFSKYSIYDLPLVQELSRRFLATQGIYEVMFPSLGNRLESKIDLVISNYAFSELPRYLQEVYVNEVLLHSRCGYLTMNSGRENRTGRSTGKLSIDEIQRYLPNSKILEEVPKSGPDNYLLVWFEKKD
jgi:hypothetical protein